MRARDLVSICIFATATILISNYGRWALQHLMLNATEINRDDARRVASTLLTQDQWVEFSILRDATNLRVLTNAALKSTDAPDHDLTNPRLGWRYSLTYELLDADRQPIRQSQYHFRSQIRQLLEVERGTKIYPIFVGKNGLVSTQTRMMQLSLDQFESRPTTIRIRLHSTDPGIQEVTARLLSRIERDDYDKRFTWNRLSEERRDAICRHCVYEPDLLTRTERNNLLRWRWAHTPAIAGDQNRYMYFIGDVDDQEVRDEQLPIGAMIDPHWPATIPVPEGAGFVRLEFEPVESLPAEHADIVIRWFGLGPGNRWTRQHQLSRAKTVLRVDTDGGLLQIESPRRAVVRAFWSLHPQSAGTGSEEIEITPDPIFVKTFLVDQTPLEYEISHHARQTTHVRVSLRYPFGLHFGNQLGRNTGAVDPEGASAQWEFVDPDGNIIKKGATHFQPVVSKYECLQLYGQNEFLSQSHDLYFQVPVGVQRIRLRSSDSHLLANVSIRPSELPRTTQIPEDYHPYQARQSRNRTWFGLNPPQQHALVQDNRCVIVRAQNRPPEDDDEILAGNYQWRRFVPNGRWIGRQMLVPIADELELDASKVGNHYHELLPGKTYDFHSSPSAANIAKAAKLIWIGHDAPGNVHVTIDGELVLAEQLDSARGELDLNDISVPQGGRIAITSDIPARFFFAGRGIDNVARYIKRTAQRLGQMQLEFDYEKQSFDEELLTIKLYRRSREARRAKLRVTIDPIGSQHDDPAQLSELDPANSWTIRNRVYDLRPLPGHGSILLGSPDQVDVGHRCFVRLGKDLQPGTYRIKLRRLDDVHDGYVLMYQTTPGALAIRNIRIHSNRQGTDDQ